MMSNMTIGRRLGISAGMSFLVTLALAGTSVLSIGSLDRALDKAYQRDAGRLEVAGELDADLHEMVGAENAALRDKLLKSQQRYEGALGRFREISARVDKNLAVVRSLLDSEAERQALAEVDNAYRSWLPAHDQVFELASKGDVEAAAKLQGDRLESAAASANRAIEAFVQEVVSAAQRDNTAADAAAVRSYWTGIALLIAAMLVAAVSFVAQRRITHTLRDNLAELAEGSAQVAAATSQVSAASQSLAQGSSEQAASLEETSASSEEITSMTKKNSESAQAVAQLTSEVDHRVGEANRSLAEMIASMKEITSAGDKISRIIKVIDEIAFQTNILALNAAVEAARAGEAGLGFAVVADEVRTLAQRSAQAAKDTAAMIEESIAKSSEGSTKLNQVAQAISAITESAKKVKTLADEVNLGSQEQASGIGQIARAITQMEEVTQRTAANAEASASASEELNAQANAMRSVVANLRRLVEGDDAVAGSGRAAGAGSGSKGETRIMKSLSALEGAVGVSQKPAKPQPVPVPAKGSKEQFPLDDEFKEF